MTVQNTCCSWEFKTPVIYCFMTVTCSDWCFDDFQAQLSSLISAITICFPNEFFISLVSTAACQSHHRRPPRCQSLFCKSRNSAITPQSQLEDLLLQPDMTFTREHLNFLVQGKTSRSSQGGRQNSRCAWQGDCQDRSCNCSTSRMLWTCRYILLFYSSFHDSRPPEAPRSGLAAKHHIDVGGTFLCLHHLEDQRFSYTCVYMCSWCH